MSEAHKGFAPRPGFIPGVPINLGGHMLVLAPLGLRLARELEAQAKDAGEDQDKLIDLGVATIHASLARNYPEITIEEVRDLLDAGNIGEAQQAIAGISGLKKVVPGELPPRG